jgi:hypothetical protein
MIEIPDELPIPRDAFERQRSLLSAHVQTFGRPSQRRRGRLVAVLAAALVLGALLVAPAPGIGGRLIDLLQGPPAPPEVQTHFAANDANREKMLAFAKEAGEKLHDRFSPVIASEARGVFAIQSPDGPIYLWAAPTEDGRQCWLIQAGAEVATGRPYGLGSCDSTDNSAALRPGTFWTAERPSVTIVHVRVYDETITRVDVESEGALALSLPVVAGYALGTVPKEERVLALVGRNADGVEVTRFELRSAE